MRDELDHVQHQNIKQSFDTREIFSHICRGVVRECEVLSHTREYGFCKYIYNDLSLFNCCQLILIVTPKLLYRLEHICWNFCRWSILNFDHTSSQTQIAWLVLSFKTLIRSVVVGEPIPPSGMSKSLGICYICEPD